MSGRFYKMTTQKGYAFGEASSALQKSIRRGLEEEALFWATELDKSGFGEYVWKRLKIIASEDVGVAWVGGPVIIQALYHSWLEKKRDEEHYPKRLFLVHAVMLLARAQKSRIVDHALCCFYNKEMKSPLKAIEAVPALSETSNS